MAVKKRSIPKPSPGASPNFMLKFFAGTVVAALAAGAFGGLVVAADVGGFGMLRFVSAIFILLTYFN